MKKHPYLTAFMLNLMIALCAIGWVMLTHGGRFTLAGDFNSQQLTFAEYGNQAVKSGRWGWDFALDLGSSFIGGMSFYILGNPSFWLSLIFPSGSYIYLVGWFYILKYALAGLTAFAYIRTIVKKDEAAWISSMLYAFSGFMAEALLFYHFHDVVYLFPLLLLTLDQLMEKKKRGPFALAVLLNAVVSYYFFFGEVIFLMLYFLVCYGHGSVKTVFKKMIDPLIEGVLGGGIGLALLLPAAMFVFQNPRVENDYYLGNSLVYSAERYLFILKGLLFPGEVMSDQSAVIQKNFSTCAAYLPMVGMVLVLAFFFHKVFSKHWLRKMLIVCAVFAAVPILNASFGMFAGLYCRWYYMAILMMSCASALVIARWQEEKEVFSQPVPVVQSIFKGAVIWASAAVIFAVMIVLIPWNSKGDSKLYSPELFTAWMLISLCGTVMTWLLMRYARKNALRILCFAVAFFALGTTLTSVVMYRSVSGDTTEEVAERLTLSDDLDLLEDAYRYTNRDNFELLRQGLKGSGSFCSTVSGSIFRLYTSLGLERSVKSPDAPEGFNELISARYTFENEPREDEDPIKVIYGDHINYYVYEDTTVPSIGFTYDTYVTASEFAELSVADRAPAMLQTLVIPDDEEAEVSRVLQHETASLTYLTDQARTDGVRYWSTYRQMCQADNYSENKNGFTASVKADHGCYVFFSIPNDDGWSCSINGKNVSITDVNGFMAVPVSEGDNQLVFTYTTPGLKAGIAGSILCLVCLIIYIKMMKRSRYKVVKSKEL